MMQKGNIVKHQFDLVIKSQNSDVVLKFNSGIRKWEAVSLADNKVLARRKNVEGLVAAINNEAEAA